MPDAEITLEANPDDITREKLLDWKHCGINRLSIGIQSFFQHDLQWMNRAHDQQQALHCIELAHTAGYTNLTIDLIYGTPSLTDEQWSSNLQTAINFNIPHLSCYALTVEPGTALHHSINNKKLPDVDADKQARQFEILMEVTQAAGYEQYEISNFAKPGFRSKHNSSYWQGIPYLGLGPSAHSFNGSSRQWNVSNNSLYIQSLRNNEVPFEEEILTANQQFNEYVMTSLRTLEGLSLTKVETAFGKPLLAQLLTNASPHIQRHHLRSENDHLIINSAAKFLADGIAADLFVLDT